MTHSPALQAVLDRMSRWTESDGRVRELDPEVGSLRLGLVVSKADRLVEIAGEGPVRVRAYNPDSTFSDGDLVRCERWGRFWCVTNRWEVD